MRADQARMFAVDPKHAFLVGHRTEGLRHGATWLT